MAKPKKARKKTAKKTAKKGAHKRAHKKGAKKTAHKRAHKRAHKKGAKKTAHKRAHKKGAHKRSHKKGRRRTMRARHNPAAKGVKKIRKASTVKALASATADGLKHLSGRVTKVEGRVDTISHDLTKVRHRLRGKIRDLQASLPGESISRLVSMSEERRERIAARKAAKAASKAETARRRSFMGPSY